MTNKESGSKVIIGQQWDLLFPLESVPESLTHIAFPPGVCHRHDRLAFPRHRI